MDKDYAALEATGLHLALDNLGKSGLGRPPLTGAVPPLIDPGRQRPNTPCFT